MNSVKNKRWHATETLKPNHSTFEWIKTVWQHINHTHYTGRSGLFQIQSTLRHVHNKSLWFTPLIFLLINANSLMAQCNFTIIDTDPCGETVVNFSTELNLPGYSWDFNDDGYIDTTGTEVSYVYPATSYPQNFIVTLYNNGVPCQSQSIEIQATPDPTIGIIPGTGSQDENEIRVCSGDAIATLSIFNNSSTFATNHSYTFDWGDGTSENYDNSSFPTTGFISHEYNGFGYYDLLLTVTGDNGCAITENYTFYNGSNPSVGLANPGNTVGLCIPATITFPITNTENNPTGTVYFVYISGEQVASYTQDDVPDSFTYTFDETSCGLVTSTGNYLNAYDVQIEAWNPCSSSQATIEPIELSAPPEPEITISEPFPCIGSPTTITNTSQTFEVANGNCSTNLAASWTITPGSPGVDWNILSGNVFSSNQLDLEFLTDGEYIITMSINSEDCGTFEISDTISTVNLATAAVDLDLQASGSTNGEECAPTIATFSNLSQGEDLTWYWFVSPITGFEFIDSTTFLSTDATIQFNDPGNYEITLFATNACSSVTWDTIIRVAEAPELYLDPLSDYCEEATLSFDATQLTILDNGSSITNYEWQFPGASPATSTEPFPQGIFYNTPGNYTITLSASNACGTTILTDSFSILQPGALNLSTDTTVCIDAPGFLLNASPTGGTWSGTGVSPDGWFDPALAQMGGNELSYEYNDAGCLATGGLTVIVEDLPPVDAGPNQTVCVDAPPFFISGGSPANGNWSSDNNGIILSNSVFDPQASGPGVYNLTYTYADLNGCENFDSKVIIVHELPTVEAGPDRSICDNPNDIQLDGFYPPGGIWSGTGISSEGIFNVNNTPALGTYELFYTITDANTGCSNTDFIAVTIIENPLADAGPDQSVCISDGLIQLSEGSPSGGQWVGPGVNTAGGFFDPLQAGVGVHNLTYSFGEGICETNDEVVIYVEALPEITVPQDQNLCINHEIVDLSDASPAGGEWSGDGIQGNQFNPVLAGVGTHLLTYLYINPTTGCSNTATLTMQVLSIPQPTVADTTYCNTPGIVQLPLAQPPGGSWSGSGVIEGTFDPQLAGGVGNYDLTYSYTNIAGCGNFANATISVVPPAIIDAGPNDTICIDQGLYELEGFDPVGAIWSGPGIIDSINGIFDPEAAGGGTHTIIYSTGVGNCQVQDTRFIHIINLTDAALGQEVELCASDDPIYINDNGPTGGQWTGNGIVDSEAGLFDPAVAGGGVHTVTYTYTNATIGCNAFIVKDIIVHELPQPAMVLPDLGCIDETLQLQNTSNGSYDFSWDFGDGFSSLDTTPIHIYENLGQYTITLVAEDAFGCVDSTSQNIIIAEAPQPIFELDVDDGCAPLEVQVTNQSTGFDVEFSWYFSNGTSSFETNPGPVVFPQGINDTTYYITLAAVNACGATYYQDSVLVYPQPVADFGISQESICTPVIANFANTTTGSATSFNWDFGNGNISTDSLPAPQIYFTDTTTIYYTVVLTAANQCGTSTAVQEVAVDPADVQSFFSASTNSGCLPLTVDFSDFSTPGANVDWIFGDGNSSTLADPTHTFSEPGTYTVIQYASSTCGYDSTTIDITVYPIPEVSFEHTLVTCLGEEVFFENLSEGVNGNVWDFGDGDTSYINNPSHIFTEPGIYTITLTGFSAFNQCPNFYESTIEVLNAPTAAFEPSVQADCVPLSLELMNSSIDGAYYEWDFGDGNSSTQFSPSHTYYDPGTYAISLIVTDQNGCYHDTIAWNIQVYPNPVIDFEVEQPDLCGLPAEIGFNNLSEGASGYHWYFGDSYESFLNSPSHTYYDEGNYDIKLIAATTFGCLDSLERSISVRPQPLADFSIESIVGCSPLEVFFNNESTDATGMIWSFGDGEETTALNPFHLYDEAGVYDVQLIVNNDEICFDTLLFEAAVEVLQDPLAQFDVVENANGSFQFVNFSSYATDYFWDFSDGTTSEQVNPSHRFLTNGVKQIYLEASSENGCVDDTLITIEPDFMKALYIPNGFSPEQGIGDVRLFKPKGVGIKEYHIQVFSTYGQLLWESTALEKGQPAQSWNGKLDGVILPQDVYVWKASAIFEDGSVWQGVDDGNGGFKTMGSVILLR